MQGEELLQDHLATMCARYQNSGHSHLLYPDIVILMTYFDKGELVLYRPLIGINKLYLSISPLSLKLSSPTTLYLVTY